MRANSFFWLSLALLAAIAAIAQFGCTDKTEQVKKAQIAYDLGVEAFKSTDYRSALAHFQKAVEDDPEFARAYNALGLLYHSMRRYNDAIENYERALEYDPKMSEAMNNLAAVYIDQGRYEKAEPLLKKAIGDLFYKTPYLAENNLGWACYKMGRTEESIRHIRKALIINPDFCLGYRNLGQIHEEQQNPAESLKAYQQYAGKCAKEPDAHYRYGVALAKGNQSEEAIKSFNKCADLDRGGALGDECVRLGGARSTPPPP